MNNISTISKLGTTNNKTNVPDLINGGLANPNNEHKSGTIINIFYV